MTPHQYIKQLGALVAAGKDREALAFARAAGPTVRPPLDADQFSSMGGLLESAAMAVSMEVAAAQGWARPVQASEARSRATGRP